MVIEAYEGDVMRYANALVPADLDTAEGKLG
jgi:hypothetical protein